jgi:hypothetical protein
MIPYKIPFIAALSAALLISCTKKQVIEKPEGAAIASLDSSGTHFGLTVNVADYATSAQLAGTADATSAWQAAVNAVAAAGGGLIISPSDAQWWFSGSVPGGNYRNMVLLSTDTSAPVHDITFDGRGCKIFKTSKTGPYVIFLDRFGALGYGGGANRLVFKNFNVYGSFTDGAEASVNFFTGNHSSDITFKNITFNYTHLQSSHSFELAGCDNILFEDCTWLGFKWDSTSAPRSEAINTDNSVVGTGAAVAGYADGLPCKNMTVNRCKFYPWRDPATNTQYPAGAVIGTHGSVEFGRPENIVINDLLVVDPPADNGATSASVDNPYIRGLVHFPAVKGLTVRNMRVQSTNNQSSIRCITAQSSSTGVLASSDPDNPVSGTYSTPLLAEDIDVEITATGMLGGTVETNNLVQVVGVSGDHGAARNVRIKISANGVYKNAVYLRYVNDATVDVNLKNVDAVRFTSCNRVHLSGIMDQVRAPLVAHTCSQITVGPLTATHTTTQSALLHIQNGTDYVTASNINAVGYTKLYSVTPAHHDESSVVGPSLP